MSTVTTNKMLKHEIWKSINIEKIPEFKVIETKINQINLLSKRNNINILEKLYSRDSADFIRNLDEVITSDKCNNVKPINFEDSKKLFYLNKTNSKQRAANNKSDLVFNSLKSKNRNNNNCNNDNNNKNIKKNNINNFIEVQKGKNNYDNNNKNNIINSKNLNSNLLFDESEIIEEEIEKKKDYSFLNNHDLLSPLKGNFSLSLRYYNNQEFLTFLNGKFNKNISKINEVLSDSKKLSLVQKEFRNVSGPNENMNKDDDFEGNNHNVVEKMEKKRWLSSKNANKNNNQFNSAGKFYFYIKRRIYFLVYFFIYIMIHSFFHLSCMSFIILILLLDPYGDKDAQTSSIKSSTTLNYYNNIASKYNKFANINDSKNENDDNCNNSNYPNARKKMNNKQIILNAQAAKEKSNTKSAFSWINNTNHNPNYKSTLNKFDPIIEENEKKHLSQYQYISNQAMNSKQTHNCSNKQKTAINYAALNDNENNNINNYYFTKLDQIQKKSKRKLSTKNKYLNTIVLIKNEIESEKKEDVKKDRAKSAGNLNKLFDLKCKKDVNNCIKKTKEKVISDDECEHSEIYASPWKKNKLKKKIIICKSRKNIMQN